MTRLPEEEVVALVKHEFPQIEGTPEALSEGSDHWTWRIGDWIVRFPCEAEVAARLAAEAELMPRLASLLPLPVPNEYLLDRNRTFVAHRRLEGTSGELLRPPEHEWERIAAELGSFLSQLHSFDIREAEALGVRREHGPDPARRWAELKEMESDLRALFHDLPESHYRFIESAPAAPAGDAAPVLCHGDLKGEHFLMQGAQISGIIDWTDACISDPVWDFVGLIYWLGGRFTELVLENYRPNPPSLLQRAINIARLDSLHRLARLASGEHAGPRELLLRQANYAFGE